MNTPRETTLSPEQVEKLDNLAEESAECMLNLEAVTRQLGRLARKVDSGALVFEEIHDDESVVHHIHSIVNTTKASVE